MDVDNLLVALENDNNETIMNLSSKKILEMNYNIIKELHLDKKTSIDYLNKIRDYRYVDEVNDLKHGSYIRWINITDPSNIILTYSGLICDIRITDNGILITCKNFMHRHYTFKMEECIIFQKLTSQEKVIIYALDHLDNSDNSDKED